MTTHQTGISNHVLSIHRSPMANLASDLPDRPTATAGRFAITVPGVHPVMIERADYCVCVWHSEGDRAARAACDVIPPAKDCLQSMVERYVNAHI